MRFSIINVMKEYDGKVDGYWMQDHVGNLESATKIAIETEKVNNQQGYFVKVDIAVIEGLSSTVPMMNLWTGRIRLDERRVHEKEEISL